jgi:hypothetical protein
MSKWEKELEDIKGVIRIRKSKNRQHLVTADYTIEDGKMA